MTAAGPARAPSLLPDLARYALALVGPVGSAGAQFLLSLVLLRTLAPAEFGRFSFLLIAAQLSWSGWSALFCAPLPTLFADAARDELLGGLFTASMLGTLVATLLFGGLAALLGAAWPGALLFGAFAGLALMRWLARAHAYALARQLRATASDLAYCGTLLAGTALIATGPVDPRTGAYGALAAAAAAGLVPFGRGYLRTQLSAPAPRRLGAYRAVWQAHARWSLLGVVTTEATANAHAYLVTLLLGPGAFAPMAASALLIRPISVAMNALVEFERARIARVLATEPVVRVVRSLGLFRAVLLLVWAGTAAAGAALLGLAPGLVYPASYTVPVLALGTALWMAAALARIVRTPESALLQAAGAFRPLAFTSLWSALCSVGVVAVLLLVAPPLWSILGIVGGEALASLLLLREGRRWLKQRA